MNSLIYELPLVFTSGVLGSAHCIGMCGPISATMNLGTTRLSGALLRQVIWSSGRVFTYAFLGMLTGFAGARVTKSTFVTSQSTLVWIQVGFAIFAGVLLVIQGLLAAGWLRRKRNYGGSCLTAPLFGRLLNGGSALNVLIAGVITGFLPCGLVYSFLALAAASASVWKGPLLMMAFGMGTIPIMLVTGAGLTMASLSWRQRLMKAAAICVLIIGVLTLGRGLVFAARLSETTPANACPMCGEEEISNNNVSESPIK